MSMGEGKIQFVNKDTTSDVKKLLHPLVCEWFFEKFKNLSETQLYGVKRIHDRRNLLISAPTGGTKTLTAFLSILNYLVSLSLKKELEDRVYCVYVSPLRALSEDIKHNLVEPLKEMEKIANKKLGVRVA